MKKFISLLLLVMLGSWPTLAQTPTPPPAGPTLNGILSRRLVNCGVNPNLFGFGYLDPNTGQINGFDVDFCRAIAAAIFGDATAAQLEIYTTVEDGEDALRSGEIDILLHNVVLTLGDDTRDLEFAPANFYNGQSIMVRSENNSAEWADLDGASICVVEGSTAENRLLPYMSSLGFSGQLLTLPTLEEARDALSEGRCDAQSADVVNLTVLQQRSGDPNAFRVWQRADQLYTREPFAPVIRAGDDQWANIVRWTLWGLIEAEQLGVSSENVNALIRRIEGQTVAESDAEYIARVGPAVSRFLDPTLGIGTPLSLAPNFMLGVIREVGNYGEIYNRHLGPDAMLPIERGLNSLWRDGGLLYAPDWQ
ncbi:MAG: transporter substrate-binding domain-containing protein [Anaerolineae bacterium]|nr:transporter substrate-binding domain-containing protein [Anaerolineae bacterium]